MAEDLTGGLNNTLITIIGHIAEQQQQKKQNALAQLQALGNLFGQTGYTDQGWGTMRNAAQGAGINLGAAPWSQTPQQTTGQSPLPQLQQGQQQSVTGTPPPASPDQSQQPSAAEQMYKRDNVGGQPKDTQQPQEKPSYTDIPVGGTVPVSLTVGQGDKEREIELPGFQKTEAGFKPLPFSVPVPNIKEAQQMVYQMYNIPMGPDGQPTIHGGDMMKKANEEVFSVFNHMRDRWSDAKEKYEESQRGTLKDIYMEQKKSQDALKKVDYEEKTKKQNEDKWSDPYETNIGGKKVLVRRNLNTNKVESVAQDVSTTVKIDNSGMGGMSGGKGGVSAPNLNEKGVNPKILEGLSPANAAVVKGLAEYRLSVPAGAARRSKYWQDAIQKAMEYDPSFDEKMYPTRQRMMIAYSQGKQGQSITSLNTAIGHLDRLLDNGEKLHNSQYQIVNWGRNLERKWSGDKRVTAFGTDLTAVTNELATVFKGMGATDQEISAWRKDIDSSSSWPQIKEGFTNEAVKLMGGRLEPMAQRYEVTMGKPLRILDPKSALILKRHGIDPSTIDSTYTGQPSGGGGKRPLSTY